MKVLMVCVGQSGHLNPLLPLVGALLDRRDDVVIASGPSVRAAVEATGAGFWPAGHTEADWFARLGARTRGVPGDGLSPDRIHHYFLPRIFGEIAADDMIDDVLAAGRNCSPDLILFDTYALAAPLTAKLLGVPGVQHLVGFPLDDDVVALLNDAVSPLWRSFGHDAPGDAGLYQGLTIRICPASLERDPVSSGHWVSMRPVPLPSTATRPQGERPLVYVTFGTFFNANPGLFRTVIDGLGHAPVEVLVTVGADQDPAALGNVPGNVQVEKFVPQAELLPRCAAVVHHGGSGTMLGALAHGLPQVIIPQGADNFINATRLEQDGVARTVLPHELGADRVREDVLAVLADPGYRRAAGAVAAEISGAPAPARVAELLHERVTAPR